VLLAASRRVERPSADEAFVDLSLEPSHGGARTTSRGVPPVRAAETIRDELQRRLGLDASLGLASSRLAARIASGWAKPRGLLVVLPGYERSFVGPKPVALLGLPPHVEAALERAGLATLGQLAEADPGPRGDRPAVRRPRGGTRRGRARNSPRRPARVPAGRGDRARPQQRSAGPRADRRLARRRAGALKPFRLGRAPSHRTAPGDRQRAARCQLADPATTRARWPAARALALPSSNPGRRAGSWCGWRGCPVGPGAAVSDARPASRAIESRSCPAQEPPRRPSPTASWTRSSGPTPGAAPDYRNAFGSQSRRSCRPSVRTSA
jgi:hypothetical protein